MATQSTESVRIKNLRQMQRAFRAADRALSRELRKRLREVAEPVRATAEHKASGKIRRIGTRWNRMRVGQTQRSVYVAPREKGRASRTNPRIRRRNLADLLMDRAMEPALAENEPVIVRGIEDMLDDVGRQWEHER